MLTLLLKLRNFFYGPQAHVRPVPRNVPGDVLRAPLARPRHHASGPRPGTASLCLHQPAGAGRVEGPLITKTGYSRHDKKVMHNLLR
jgi:hypothetical protein